MTIRDRSKQYALAFALGVNESTVTRWLAGAPMSLESAIALCRELDISMDWMVLGIGAMDRQADADGAPARDEELMIAAFRAASRRLSPLAKARLIDLVRALGE